MIDNDLFAQAALPNGSVPYTNNGLNQLTKIGAGPSAKTVTHDARGNIVDLDAGGTYSYGADNAMQGAPGGSFISDAFERLFRIDSENVHLRYDAGGAITSEHDGSTGAVLRRYISAGGDEPLARYEGAGVSNRRFLIADERGSIVALSDESGNVTAINRYDEYGVPASGNTGRFQYTGQAWIPSMAAYYYKARILFPEIGGFAQPDPIGYAAGMNLYGYVGGDPVNYVDPLGLRRVCSVHDRSSWNGSEVIVTAYTSCVDLPDSQPRVGGGERGSTGDGKPQNDKEQDKACGILNDKSKSSSGTLPGYLTGNKNWDNSSTLRGYQNYYQSNANQWQAANGRVAGYALVGLGMIPIVRGGTWAVRAGGFATGAAGWELGNFMQGQQRLNENKVSAIQGRLNVQEAGCGRK